MALARGGLCVWFEACGVCTLSSAMLENVHIHYNCTLPHRLARGPRCRVCASLEPRQAAVGPQNRSNTLACAGDSRSPLTVPGDVDAVFSGDSATAVRMEMTLPMSSSSMPSSSS
jgi:hypothetical protein